MTNDTERVAVYYKDELVAAGMRAAVYNAFWNAIRLDPTYSAEAVHQKLLAIRQEDRVHFEWRGVDYIAFPPAYQVRSDNSLLGV